MSKKFEFRGKTHDGELVYGGVVFSENLAFIISHSECKTCGDEDECNHERFPCYKNTIDVLPDSVVQLVCPDKNGKPVFAGNEVDLVAGDRFERCHRGCIVTPLRKPRHGYGLVAKREDSDFTTDTFYPSEIELIEKSEADNKDS